MSSCINSVKDTSIFGTSAVLARPLITRPLIAGLVVIAGGVRTIWSDKGIGNMQIGSFILATGVTEAAMIPLSLTLYFTRADFDLDLVKESLSSRVEVYFYSKIKKAESGMKKRAYILGQLPFLLAARIADLVAGVFGYLGMIATLGMNKSVNGFAINRFIAGFSIIADVPVALLSMLRPSGYVGVYGAFKEALEHYMEH